MWGSKNLDLIKNGLEELERFLRQIQIADYVENQFYLAYLSVL